MKAIFMSIHPEWCRLILSGKKTVEIRRSKPHLETPFKVYIYCTLSGSNELFKNVLNGDIAAWNREKWSLRKGNVIAEFTCDKVATYDYAEMFEPPDWEVSLGDQYYIPSGDLECSCLSYEDLLAYGRGKKLYGWHISDLKIYDTPVAVNWFQKPSTRGSWWPSDISLKKPPQSWCYVEEMPNG